MTDGPTCKPQSALLSFKAENARSYRDEVELSLLAGRLSPKSIVRTLRPAGQPVRVLPAVGIFGANASGKSTLLKAMADMRKLVLGSFRREDELINDDGSFLADAGCFFELYEPFKLVPYPDSATLGLDPALFTEGLRSTRFAVDLILDGVRWQYGLEIGRLGILSEYAYHFPNGRAARVFHRERDSAGRVEFVFGPGFRSEGRRLTPFVRPYVLVLSVAGAAGFEHLAPLFAWFRSNLILAEPANLEGRVNRTIEHLRKPHGERRVLALLRAADLGIVGAASAPSRPDLLQRVTEAIRSSSDPAGDVGGANGDYLPTDGSIRLTHRGPYGDVALTVADESLGTLAWAGLIGPMLDALERGSVLLVDELDSSLHPRLVDEIVDAFQRPRRNPNAAQLIFNAHDVTLLGDSAERTLARDQVWFTEKQVDGATTLYPLSDFNPRHDEAIERRYRQGRYGGVPTINPAGFEQLALAFDE